MTGLPNTWAAAVPLALALIPALAAPARADYQNVYSAGHADLNIGYDPSAGALFLNYEFASNAVINGSILGSAGAGERDPITITTFLNTNTLGTGPAGLPAPFAGNPLWVLPQTSQVGKPFLGIGAEEIDPGLFQNDTLALTLVGFAQRPVGGEFVLWQTGSESNPFINSADGLTALDRVLVGAGSHDHYNWGFTAEGIYDLTFRATGTLVNGTQISGDAVYRFAVGPNAVVPEPGSIALAAAGLGVWGAGRCLRRLRRAVR